MTSSSGWRLSTSASSPDANAVVLLPCGRVGDDDLLARFQSVEHFDRARRSAAEKDAGAAPFAGRRIEAKDVDRRSIRRAGRAADEHRVADAAGDDRRLDGRIGTAAGGGGGGRL